MNMDVGYQLGLGFMGYSNVVYWGDGYVDVMGVNMGLMGIMGIMGLMGGGIEIECICQINIIIVVL